MQPQKIGKEKTFWLLKLRKIRGAKVRYRRYESKGMGRPERQKQRCRDGEYAQTYCQDIMNIEISCFLQERDVQQILKIKVR